MNKWNLFGMRMQIMIICGLTLILVFISILYFENNGDNIHHNISRQQKIGIWGIPTGTLDFCEQNYKETVYIAEYYNTFTSTSYLISSIIGMIVYYRYSMEIRW